MTDSARDWQPISLAPDNETVWTKIDDEHGERNVAKLTRKGRLWYTSPDPDKGMYVYYTPTHWARP
jgi:hypothetical protein